ncbi:hypothetical protein GCM10027422_25820 [Hymenobacter arcticus]
MLGQPHAPQWVAWLNIGFFGLSYPLGIYQLLDRRPKLIINEVGIFDRTTHRDFINWQLIEEVYLTEINRQTFICLVVPKEFEPSRRKGFFGRGVAQLNKALGFQELNIALGAMRVDAVRLGLFLVALSQADRPTRAQLLTQAHSIL